MYSRESVQAGGLTYKQVRRLVAEGKLDEAITALLASLGTDEPELVDQAAVLSGRFNRLAADESHQRLTREAADVERQRISESLLKLVRAAEGHVAPKPDVVPLSAKEKQARAWYLKAFRKKIENLLNASIHKARLLDLGIQDTQEATHVPWIYLGADTKSFSRIQEAIEAYEGRLLVLGAPGSGKTTTLQHIALQLIEQAEKDDAAPIPVLVNLSKFRMDAPEPFLRTWVKWPSRDKTPPRRFETWLADEIAVNPDVSHAVALKWIQEDRVATLLDGLDEVNDERRAELVHLLNRTFLRDHLHSFVVVSSRVDEYEPLKGQEQKRLQLYGAVTLTPLSVDQIRTYLVTARADGLAQALEKDASLMELARTPLTLSMMTLAYADLPEGAIRADLTLTDRRHHLMEAYVSRMLQRNERRARGHSLDAQRGPDVPPSEYRYSPDQINRYLGWLAVRLSVRMQTACSVGRFYSFLSRPLATGQQSPDIWATSLALAFFIAMAHALLALSLVPDAPSALPAAALIVMGATVFSLRGRDVFRDSKLVDSIKSPLSGPGSFAGACIALAIVAKSVSTLIEGRLGPLAIGLLLLSTLTTVIALDSWRFLMGTAISLAVGAALSIWLPSGSLAGLLLPVTLYGGQALTIAWLERHSDKSPYLTASGWEPLIPLLSAMLVVGGLAGVLYVLPNDAWYLALGVMVVAMSLLVPADQRAVVPSLALSVCVGTGALLAEREGAVVGAGLFGMLVSIYLNWRDDFREKDSFGRRISRYVSGRFADLEVLVERWVLSPVVFFVLALERSLPIAAPSFFRYCGRALLLKSAEREVEFIHRRLRDHFALRELMPRLLASDMSVRLAAIHDVGYQGASAVETLAELASQQDPDVRAAAVSALGHIASPEVVALLQRAMQDDAPQVRLAVMRGYRVIPNEALGELLMHAATDENLEVQLAAVEVAIEAEHGQAPAVIERVLTQRSDRETLRRALLAATYKSQENMGIAWRYVSYLARLLPPSSGELLRRLADEEEDQVRLGAMSLIEERLEFAELGHTIQRLQKDRVSEVRRVACSVLGLLYRDAAATLEAPVPSDVSEKRMRITDVLLSALSDFSEAVCAQAIRGLAYFDDPRGIEAIRPMLKSGSSIVRMVAAQVLGSRGDLRDAPALQQLLRDPSEIVREAAAMSLGEIRASGSIKILVRALGDRGPGVRQAAARALGRLKATEAASALRKASLDRNADVRIAAAVALLHISGDSTALFELARNPGSDVRINLARRLAEISQDVRVAEVVAILLKDPDSEVREAASAALKGEVYIGNVCSS